MFAIFGKEISGGILGLLGVSVFDTQLQADWDLGKQTARLCPRAVCVEDSWRAWALTMYTRYELVARGLRLLWSQAWLMSLTRMYGQGKILAIPRRPRFLASRQAASVHCGHDRFVRLSSHQAMPKASLWHGQWAN